MKFFVVEYIKEVRNEEHLVCRLFDYDHDQDDAQAFAKSLKEFGIPTNIRVRDIDYSQLVQ